MEIHGWGLAYSVEATKQAALSRSALRREKRRSRTHEIRISRVAIQNAGCLLVLSIRSYSRGRRHAWVEGGRDLWMEGRGTASNISGVFDRPLHCDLVIVEDGLNWPMDLAIHLSGLIG